MNSSLSSARSSKTHTHRQTVSTFQFKSGFKRHYEQNPYFVALATPKNVWVFGFLSVYCFRELKDWQWEWTLLTTRTSKDYYSAKSTKESSTKTPSKENACSKNNKPINKSWNRIKSSGPQISSVPPCIPQRRYTTFSKPEALTPGTDPSSPKSVRWEDLWQQGSSLNRKWRKPTEEEMTRLLSQ